MPVLTLWSLEDGTLWTDSWPRLRATIATARNLLRVPAFGLLTFCRFSRSSVLRHIERWSVHTKDTCILGERRETGGTYRVCLNSCFLSGEKFRFESVHQSVSPKVHRRASPVSKPRSGRKLRDNVTHTFRLWINSSDLLRADLQHSPGFDT